MFMLLAAVLVASQDAPAPVQVQDPAATQKKVCRKVETTSSRMSKRVCKTEAEWAQSDKSANKADLQRMGAR